MVLIFFLEIDVMNKFVNVFENKGYVSLVIVYLVDELCKEKVEWLWKGKIKLLLIIIILERGVIFIDV